MERICHTIQHINPNSQSLKDILDISKKQDEISTYSKIVRQNGQGFSDTFLKIGEDGNICVAGNRYIFSGTVLPHFRKWVEDEIGLDISRTSPPQNLDQIKLNDPIINEDFLKAIDNNHKFIYFSKVERLLHSHGHTCQDIWSLRYGNFSRCPDAVIYPGSHNDVEAIIKAAVRFNVVLIPYGGGTSVSSALQCPENENRMIVSLDMHEMNKIKQINRLDMTASIEAGAIGRDIEENLIKKGLTMGHEPDSSEFSSLGGQISTRASGMMKNEYGNIEEIVKQITIVTPSGTFRRTDLGPRVSIGPNLNEFIIGSEGILGVVTEAVVKIHAIPEVTKYGSLIFPDFDSGVHCLHEVARKRCAPVSIRLVDNDQFRFGQALKSPVTSSKQIITDKLKKLYVTKALRFDPNKMVVATLKFIGSLKEVSQKEQQIFSIAKKI